MKRIEYFIGTEFEKDGTKIKPITREMRLALTRSRLVDAFGGVSLSYVDGSWKNEAGDIVTERSVVALVFIHATQEWDALSIAHGLAELWRQEKVLYVVTAVDGQWITPRGANEAAA